jgi:hypothetical protein
MSIIKVETITGLKELRKHCRKIGEAYYLIGRDCFEVEGKFYKKDSNRIVYDHEEKKWLLAENAELLVKGIVGFKKGVTERGMYTPNPYNNCMCTLDGIRSEPAMNTDILLENDFIENFSEGLYYHKKLLTQSLIRDFQKPRNKLDNTRHPYNAEDGDFVGVKKLFDAYPMIMSKDVKSYGRFLGDSTFGIEFETIRGSMPKHILNRMGIIVCRDGSLKDTDGTQGAEYVTVPMSGARCLQNIVTICTELDKRSELSIDCSLHIHQGNLPTSRLYLTSLYLVGLRLQDDLFKMFPYYKTDPTGIKQKNYNQKLKKLNVGTIADMSKEGYENYITSIYRKIFVFLSEGVYPDAKYNRQNKKHPHRAKWDRHSRYYWLNLMNTIFSERNTVEYRPHPGTLNSQKVINWLFIINAISKYALVNAKKVITSPKKITLEEVLKYYEQNYPGDRAKFLTEYLTAYVTQRKAIFERDLLNEDALSLHDLTGDSDFEFNYKGVTHLF